MKKKHRPVPFFLAWNPKVLSEYLTAGLPNDSAKAAAIHSWITYNIKYNVKHMWQARASNQSIKRILWRKKAICGGYSDLFAELCTDAGIKAVTLEGYTKSIHTDIIDTFFVQDHAWNAVLINGRWEAVDATWDAGFILPFHKTVFDWALYAVTLGHADHYSGGPIFITWPRDEYFLPNPGFMAVTHFPVNPTWQLAPAPLTAEAFRADSAYYYQKFPEDTGHTSQADNGDRENYCSQKDTERIIIDGKNGYRANKMNSYALAEGLKMISFEEGKKMKDMLADSFARWKQCDTILKYADSGLRRYDMFDSLADIQMERLMRHNDEKREIFRSYNPAMVTGTEMILKKMKYARAKSRRLRKYCNHIIESNQTRDNRYHQHESFYSKRFATATNSFDSLNIRNEMDALDDSIDKFTLALDSWRHSMDSLYTDCKQRFASYDSGQYINTLLVLDQFMTRTSHYDDYDHEIKQFLNPLLKSKPAVDSGLFIKGEFATAYLYEMTHEASARQSRLHSLYREKARLISRLKRACSYNGLILHLYRMNEDSLHNMLETNSQWLKQWENQWKTLSKACMKRVPWVKAECKLLRYNSVMEHYNSISRSAWAHRNASRLRAIGHRNRVCLQYLRNKAADYKERITPWKVRHAQGQNSVTIR